MATKTSPIERILARVVESGDCWIFTGRLMNRGYGQIVVERKSRLVHRVSYETFNGPIPVGLVIDHLCGNRACVNPAHLEAVTQRENSLRSEHTLASRNGAKTHCPKGHPYDHENTQWTVNSGGRRTRERHCRQCQRDRHCAAKEG